MTIYGHEPKISFFEEIFNLQPIRTHVLNKRILERIGLKDHLNLIRC